MEAGKITSEELDAYRQEQLHKEESEKALREAQTEKRREYARVWARKKRSRLKAERDARALLDPPDSEVSPEVLKERKHQRKLVRDRERIQEKRDRERAEKRVNSETERAV